MSLHSIITALDLKNLTDPKAFEASQPTSVYASDLLSCVMASAQAGESGYAACTSTSWRSPLCWT